MFRGVEVIEQVNHCRKSPNSEYFGI